MKRGCWAIERIEQLGGYTLVQPPSCFPLGGDTLALGGFATVRREWRVCDLGCGSGALGLLLLGREPTLALTGVELDPVSAAAAERNMRENELSAAILCGDLRDPRLLPPGGFELVLSNPPWFREGSGRSGGQARMEHTCTLEELCTAAGRLVKNGGRFALVHRPERLTDVLLSLRAHHLEPKRLQMIQHGPAAPASAVLVEAVRQGRPGLEVLPAALTAR